MQWSPEQDHALRAVNDWYQSSSEQVFRVFGYAGTGKTTLARHFAEHVSGTVLFAAYTGKAAHVLRQRGCAGASTIHSLIYTPKEKSRIHLQKLELTLGELRHGLKAQGEDPDQHPKVHELTRWIQQEREALSRPAFSLNPDSPVLDADLVIIDECSMVDGRMGQDLLCFNKKVLVLGDPAQLPPVAQSAGFFTNHEPNIMLTEIHRQARENPIIALATQVREGQPLKLGTYGESEVINRIEMKPERALASEQILVGRNATRHATNRRMRSLLGLTDLPCPVVGDKLVCLRNNHDLGLLNGSLWKVVDVGEVDEERIYMTIEPLDGLAQGALEVEAHAYPFQGGGTSMSWWERREAEEFDYGYALTVHKAQGSQWESVLILDESGVFRADRWRWLYTAITRASDRVTVVAGM